MAKRVKLKPVILEPGDYTSEQCAEGTALNYTDAAEAKFKAAGWDILGKRHPLVVELLPGGRVKLTPKL